jgi:uncharacterized cupin superfamily protein
MSYTHLRKDDPAIEAFRGQFLKIRRALGTNAFGLNEVRLPPGAQGLEHDEGDTGHEEVYFVVEGAGTVAVDGEEVQVAPGDYLRIEPGATRVVTAGADGLRFLALGARPQDDYQGRESL